MSDRRAEQSHLGAVLLLSLSLGGCVRDKPQAGRETGDGPLVVASWDFSREEAPSAVTLWPALGAPRRMKRAVKTREGDGSLEIVVSGADPAFSWEFPEPVALGIAEAVVTADAPGTLQLFWTSSDCPVYSEACSSKAPLASGTTLVDFFLDARHPLRTLRLDPPDHAGARLELHSFSLRKDGVARSAFRATGTVRVLEETPLGLRIDSSGGDPGVTVSTPGLAANTVTGAELVLRAPPGSRPQLFWTSDACPVFSEACSVFLTPTDAGASTHRAKLAGHPQFHGQLTNLRLDPGASPGAFTVEHFALVSSPDD
ncbi:MAG TPA: hypothetical protein VHE30_11530 [Polyangiaceae bacterium]|nr:hypothetical protein [Polyangiaceae bacterium]